MDSFELNDNTQIRITYGGTVNLISVFVLSTIYHAYLHTEHGLVAMSNKENERVTLNAFRLRLVWYDV